MMPTGPLLLLALLLPAEGLVDEWACRADRNTCGRETEAPNGTSSSVSTSVSWDSSAVTTSISSLRSALGTSLRDAVLDAAHGRLVRFPCSQADVDAVLAAGNEAGQVVADMMLTRSKCAICILPCASAECIRDCRGEHHHSANTTLLSLKRTDEPACMQCAPEIVESVCGDGCISHYTRQVCRSCSSVEKAQFYAAQILDSNAASVIP